MLAKTRNNYQQTIKSSLKTRLNSWLQPNRLVTIACKMPIRLNQSLIDFTLNQVFKQLISDGDFDFLKQRLLQIHIEDAALWLSISHDKGHLKTSHFSHRTSLADATLSLKTMDAILLIEQQIDPDTLFFQRRLKITGDTQMAHQAKNTIDRLDPEKIPKLVLKLLTNYRENILSLDSELGPIA